MTRYELLEALSEIGQDVSDTYHDELFGYIGWSLGFDNGDMVLTVTFEDSNGDTFAYEWVLNPKESA